MTVGCADTLVYHALNTVRIVFSCDHGLHICPCFKDSMHTDGRACVKGMFRVKLYRMHV